MQSLITRIRDRLLRPGRVQMPKGKREHVHLTNPWHAVSVISGPNCCAQASALAGRRFLASGTSTHERPPSLPLPGCSAATCRCRYQHHADRRRAAAYTGHTHPGPAPSALRRAEDAPHATATRG